MGVNLTFAYGLWVIGLETRVFGMVVSSGTTSDAGLRLSLDEISRRLETRLREKWLISLFRTSCPRGAFTLTGAICADDLFGIVRKTVV